MTVVITISWPERLKAKRATNWYLVEPNLNSDLPSSIIPMGTLSNYRALTQALQTFPKSQSTADREKTRICPILRTLQIDILHCQAQDLWLSLLPYQDHKDLYFLSDVLSCREFPEDRLSLATMSINNIMKLTGISFIFQCFFSQMSVQGIIVSWSIHQRRRKWNMTYPPESFSGHSGNALV